jgi:hypothetical protein
MARPCTVCRHPSRLAIDKALAAGEPCPAISQRFAISLHAAHRHRKAHLPAAILRAQEAADVANGDELFDQVKRLREKAEDLYAEVRAVLRRAKRRREPDLALAAVRSGCIALRELRQQVELVANLGKAEDTRELEAKISAFERRLGMGAGVGAP